jgi:UDP-N-acetylglucosamine acyltransferase
VIHNTAIIDKTVVIEDNVSIGAYSVIGPEVIIRKGAKISSNSIIKYSDIGSNCEISSFSSIGTCPQDLKYNDEKTFVTIGTGTVIRECVTINRGTSKTGFTVIGKNCLIMSCAHVAHDCIIGDNVILGYSTGVAGHVLVDDYAVLSSHIGVHQFCRIGKSAMIGAGSMVNLDIIPYAMVYGDRAKLIGLNTIGLKRRDINCFDILNIKKAYKVLFSSKLILSKAIVELENLNSQYVIEIVNFIKQTKRGIARPK